MWRRKRKLILICSCWIQNPYRSFRVQRLYHTSVNHNITHQAAFWTFTANLETTLINHKESFWVKAVTASRFFISGHSHHLGLFIDPIVTVTHVNEYILATNTDKYWFCFNSIIISILYIQQTAEQKKLSWNFNVTYWNTRQRWTLMALNSQGNFISRYKETQVNNNLEDCHQNLKFWCKFEFFLKSSKPMNIRATKHLRKKVQLIQMNTLSSNKTKSLIFQNSSGL